MNHFDVHFATLQGKGRGLRFRERRHPRDVPFVNGLLNSVTALVKNKNENIEKRARARFYKL